MQRQIELHVCSAIRASREYAMRYLVHVSVTKAGDTRNRNCYQKLAWKILTQVHHSFLHQKNDG